LRELFGVYLGSALQPRENGSSKQQTRKLITALRDLVRFRSRRATPITQHAVWGMETVSKFV